MSFLAIDTARAAPASGLVAMQILDGERRSFADLQEVLEALDRTLDPQAAMARALVAKASAIVSTATAPNAERFTSGGLSPWQVRKLRKHIEANLDTPLSNTELSALVSLSPSHFGKAFKISFGDTPHAYITHRRLEAAKTMMLVGHESLSQIAYQCGFADQSHLCRLFRRATGASPKAWRRQHLLAA